MWRFFTSLGIFFLVNVDPWKLKLSVDASYATEELAEESETEEESSGSEEELEKEVVEQQSMKGNILDIWIFIV